ncbi:hypothetical protein D3C76_1294630 [compost metagenome]
MVRPGPVVVVPEGRFIGVAVIGMLDSPLLEFGVEALLVYLAVQANEMTVADLILAQGVRRKIRWQSMGAGIAGQVRLPQARFAVWQGYPNHPIDKRR